MGTLDQLRGSVSPDQPGDSLIGVVRNGLFHVKYPFLPGLTVDAYAYNDQIPGPRIGIRHGDHVRVNVSNNLPEDTTVHWHAPFCQIKWMVQQTSRPEVHLFFRPVLVSLYDGSFLRRDAPPPLRAPDHGQNCHPRRVRPYDQPPKRAHDLE